MRILACAALCTLTLLAPLPAAAQLSVGPQLSFGTDSDFGLGARLVFPLRTDALGLDGAIDGNYFFTGDQGGASVDWVDLNANVRLPVPLADEFETRIGAGLNLSFVKIDAAGTSDSNSEVGLNLLGNLEFPRGAFTPFGEFRLILGGAEQVVLTGGFLFGRAR